MALDENQVIEILVEHLKHRGYEILRKAHTTEKGVDLLARHQTSARELHIEAKGGTSSRRGSARFGKPYTQSQVLDRVSKGFYTAAALRTVVRTQDEVALAVPDTPHFRKYLEPVFHIAQQADIQILLVNPSGNVSYLAKDMAS